MASTFTPNIQIEEPARGDDVGTWDTPVNNNSTLLDLVLAGTVSITLSNANVTLSAAQYQCHNIIFTGTLLANVTIFFPSAFKKPYTIQNLCGGTNSFVVNLATGLGQSLCCPPGQPFDIINDGSNIKFKNFGPHIGGYWDYAGSSVPIWVTGCSVPPYLNCDGSTFSSVTYPALAAILGGTTLPDSRGRIRAFLNQGTGRVTAGGSGVDGNTLFAAGGSEFMQSHNHTLTDPGHFHSYSAPTNFGCMSNSPCGSAAAQAQTAANTTTNTTGITIAAFGSGGSQNMPPTYVGGLTLIRAA